MALVCLVIFITYLHTRKIPLVLSHRRRQFRYEFIEWFMDGTDSNPEKFFNWIW